MTFAGEWRLDQRRCSDIREDWRDGRENRRDERHDYSRRDRVEDRVDRRGEDVRYERRSRYEAPGPKLKYDRELRMRYAYDHGGRIYVPG